MEIWMQQLLVEVKGVRKELVTIRKEWKEEWKKDGKVKVEADEGTGAKIAGTIPSEDAAHDRESKWQPVVVKEEGQKEEGARGKDYECREGAETKENDEMKELVEGEVNREGAVKKEGGESGWNKWERTLPEEAETDEEELKEGEVEEEEDVEEERIGELEKELERLKTRRKRKIAVRRYTEEGERAAEDQNQYLTKAKRLKLSADDEGELTAQCMQYMESVLYFSLTGHAMESDPRTEQAAFRMFRDTLALMKYISSKIKTHENGIHNKLAVLSLWCESHLYHKLFKMRKYELKENQKILEDFYRKPIRTLSPLIRTQSPAGLVGSRSSCSNSEELANGGAVSGQAQDAPYMSVPISIYNAMRIQNHNFSILMDSRELWDQATSLVTEEHREFFIELDEQIGPLTLTSSLRDLVCYVQAGIKKLRAQTPVVQPPITDP